MSPAKGHFIWEFDDCNRWISSQGCPGGKRHRNHVTGGARSARVVAITHKLPSCSYKLHTNLHYVWHPHCTLSGRSALLHIQQRASLHEGRDLKVAMFMAEKGCIGKDFKKLLRKQTNKKKNQEIAEGIEPLPMPLCTQTVTDLHRIQLSLFNKKAQQPLWGYRMLLELGEKSALAPPTALQLFSGQCTIQGFLPPFFRVCNDYLLQTDIQ